MSVMQGPAAKDGDRCDEALSVAMVFGISGVDPLEWDACAVGKGPFLKHAYLNALEEGGVAGPDNGWRPAHLILREASGRLVGAAPLYLRDRSTDEFWPDQAWVDGFLASGGRYFPKLVIDVPYTPVTGARLLLREGAPSGVAEAMIGTMRSLAHKHGLSSIHVGFPDEEDRARFEGAGWLTRHGIDYEWRNEGYRDFTDFTAGLRPDALRGVRIGVMRFAAGFGTDAPFEEALATLRAQGAALVDIDHFEGRDEIGRNELTVLLAELKHDMNAYLATLPADVRTRTLADLIAFNRAHADDELVFFGQELFEQAEATNGLDAAYAAARATSLRLAGPEGIDRLLRDNDVVALVGPTMPPAWPIDVVSGDQISGGGAGGLAAVAGYPHLTVPMGQVRGLPVGLSFIGPKWSDARILALGYAYEQASRLRTDPTFANSIDETPQIAPHLRPAASASAASSPQP